MELFSHFHFWTVASYKNITDFCILIWYPVTLLNSISSTCFAFFLCELFRIIYRIMSPMNKNSFKTSNLDAFLPNPHITVLARTSSEC